MKKRPVSVAVVSWILIACAALGFVVTLVMMNNPMVIDLMHKNPLPVPVQYAMGFAGFAVSIVSGIFMLQGKAWARLLYVVWSAGGLVISLATAPGKMALVPGVLFYAVVCGFLFQPAANAYFAPGRPSDDETSR